MIRQVFPELKTAASTNELQQFYVQGGDAVSFTDIYGGRSLISCLQQTLIVENRNATTFGQDRPGRHVCGAGAQKSYGVPSLVSATPPALPTERFVYA